MLPRARASIDHLRSPERSNLNVNQHNYDPNITTPYDQGPSYTPYVSDPTHPDYDPRIDPALQLRTVRTAAASIAESHRSDARRDEKRRRDRRKLSRSGSILNKLGRGRTILRKESKKEKSALSELIYSELEAGGRRPLGSGANGTGGVGIGVPFESAQQDTTPLRPTAEADEDAEDEAEQELAEVQKGNEAGTASQGTTSLKKRSKKPPQRRKVYLNTAVPSTETDRKGEPKARYPRNRVRTSKYNVVTFLPRFLYEQFHRLANVYFLGLVVIQIPSIFGATVPQIAMLPLVAILGLTAIKDGIEDHRRHVLDNQVNNSAVTKLGGWRNVNQPADPRTWFQKLFGLSGRGDAKVSKGVKKLRAKEDAIGLGALREASRKKQSGNAGYRGGDPASRTRTDSLNSAGAHGWGLETIASETERDNTSVAGDKPRGPDLYRGGSSQTALTDSVPSGSDLPSTSNNPSSSGVIDYRRNAPGTARWERTLWKKLEVGDVVLLREDEQVPADIIVLNSSGEDGIVFVETKNLDGETNLKPRRSLKATRDLQSEEDIECAKFTLDIEPPHANLYSFNALLKYSSTISDEEKALPPDSSAYAAAQRQHQHVEPVGINELLLRGCAIRNTDWVIGIVAFTGSDTKIMLNSGETPSKRSKIEKETNWNVLANFALLLSMCAICATVGGIHLNYTDTSREYYEPGALDASSNILNALIILGSCLVVFQNIVPISLYISIELVKTIQAFFIYQDADMYYEPLDHPCVPKTWNISDDLGQIEYIFSDKTGTLTQNVMEFKKCSINGTAYGDGVTEAQLGAMKRQGQDTSAFSAEAQAEKLNESKKQMVQTMTRSYKSRYLREDKLTLISTQLADDLASSGAPEQKRNIIAFFRALAICHTALSDRPDGDDPFTLEYKAESPDEAALVAAARDVGAVFLNKTNHQIDVEIMGQPERYTPLKVLEFNSTRKRMSVIVREPEGRILMITKGADSVIYQRLRKDHPEKLKEDTQRDLEEFANAGLRTLCIAYRYLEETEYVEWARTFDEAAAATTDREDKIDDACETIEHDLSLLGATALEDKLQEGVPDAIAQLHDAGIKLWVLTGDKMQTAIEIGFSCNLLNPDTEIMIVTADHEAGTRSQIEAACNKIAAAGRPVLVEQSSKFPGRKRRSTIGFQPSPEALAAGGVEGKTSYAVVIDGETLRYALDPALKPLFLALTTQCETVICCRVSPAQKALTVKLVKDGKDAMTLAIGDGANDVSMIQEAHCGVGIAGVEGAQASMSADYAIGQFRYLTKLLLVHGHWSYVRIADMHKVFFFKNIIWTFTMFWYQIFCDFNATYLYDYTYVLLFNLIFTSLPVIILGALDQDCNAKALMAFPATYIRGIKGLDYTKTLFWLSILDGVYQSAVCFFVTWACWNFFPSVSPDGHSIDSIWIFGTTIGAGAVISANLYAGLSMRFWTVIVWLVQLVSILSYFIWALVYSAFDGWYKNTAYYAMATITFWAQILLIVVLSLLPRFFAKAWRTSFMPTNVDLVREAWIRGDLKRMLRVENKAVTDLTDAETGNDTYDTDEAHSRYQYHGQQQHLQHELAEQQDGRQPREGLSSSPSMPNSSHSQSQRNSLRPGSRQSGGYWDGGRTTQMSYYDPDMIRDSSTPTIDEYNSPRRSSGAFQNADSRRQQVVTPVPQINIQRASGASSSFYPYSTGHASRDQDDDDEEQDHPATSRVALVDDVDGSPGGQYSTPPRNARSAAVAYDYSDRNEDDGTMSPTSAGARWHNRFQGQGQGQATGNGMSSAPAATGRHNQDTSYTSDQTWHTAGDSDEDEQAYAQSRRQ
ncbi:unnamed protein product [Sympodiomycopsis kandeliae]